MKQAVMKVLCFSMFLLTSLYIVPAVQAANETDFEKACASFGTIPTNDNPTRQHINCLLTNAAINADIPPEVVKGIVTTENGGWKQYSKPGVPVISSDNGIGLMQVTDPTLTSEQQERLKTDIVYNIQQGIRILNEKYNYMTLPKIAGAGRQHIENWYFPVMAYNGIVQKNRPVYLATGLKNEAAYQNKVFGYIEADSFLNQTKLAQWPFTKEDFPNAATGSGVLFTKTSYTLTDSLHPSIYSLKTGDQIELIVDSRIREGASTTTTLLKTYKKGTILKVAGNFTYDTNEASTNSFVWIPIKNDITGKLEYVASANVKIATKKDTVAPTITKLDTIADNSTVIKGTTESYATVTIQYDTTKYMVAADANGAFSFTLPKKIAAKKVVKVSAVDLAKNVGAVKSVTVIDKTAPAKAKIDVINDRSKKITGTAEKNATVTAKLKSSNKVIGTAKVSAKGTYSISIPAQKANATIIVEVKDAAGNINKSASAVVKTLKPTVTKLNSKATAVSGKGLAGTTVYVKNASGKVLGSAKVQTNGTYKVKIAAQKAATKLSIYAKDTAGNTSATATTTVQLATPTVNKVTASSTIVSGKADAGATVTVYKGSTKLGKATIDSKGNYKVKIAKQKKGTTLTVTVTKNPSLKASATIKVQ